MGSPNGEVPAGSYNRSSASSMQDVNPGSYSTNADMQGQLEGIRGNLLFNLLGGFLNIPQALGSLLNDIGLALVGGPGAIIGGILGSINSFISGIKLTVDGHETEIAAQAGSITGLDARVTALEGGGSRTVYSANFTWNNPGTGTVFVAVTNGGQSGEGTKTNTGSVAGGHGGYVAREFKCSDLPSTVAGTIGAGGSSNLQMGGTSSFGTYLVGEPNSIGAVLTKQGALASASSPGRGGNGGIFDSINGGVTLPQAGTSTALASGGAAGTNNSGSGTALAGKPGTAVDLDSDVPCGGGGGGGGGYRAAAFTDPGPGGAGGAPGGGGGGAGSRGTANAAAVASGGPGANGRITIIYIPGA